MATTFREFRDEQLRDPEIRKEYDALAPEYAIVHAMLEARMSQGMTQQQLAEKTGIKQGDISKLERGNGNPSLRTLQRLADGLGMKLSITFTPLTQKDGHVAAGT